MVVATGFFDGVHIGHRLVIDRLVAEAKESGDESMVVTFWPHPRTVLQKDAESLRFLSSLDEKKKLLHEAGVDRVEVIDFTREFSRLSASEYLREYVIGKFGGKKIILGYDNRIGCESGEEDIPSVARGLGLGVEIVPEAFSGEDFSVSSSKIRRLLANGDVETASRLLGYDYPLLGVVVSGDKIGRTIGFPTANMQLYEPLKQVPGNGVYMVSVHTLGKDWFGMCNIGMRPTVRDNGGLSIETHIFGFSEDIYGLDIRISFLKRIRKEEKFASLDALRAQLEADKIYCTEQLKEHCYVV